MYIFRSLAHAQKIPWAEYWNFLNAYVDLAQPSGLERLEEYFREQLSKYEQDDQRLLATPVMPNRYLSNEDSDRFSIPERTSDTSSVFMDDSAIDRSSVLGSPPLQPVYNENYPVITSSISVGTSCKQHGQVSLEHDYLLPTNDCLQESSRMTMIANKLDFHEMQKNVDKNAADTQMISPTHEDFQSHRKSQHKDDEGELFLCQTNLLDQLRAMNIEDDDEVKLRTDDINNKDKEQQQKLDQQHKQELQQHEQKSFRNTDQQQQPQYVQQELNNQQYEQQQQLQQKQPQRQQQQLYQQQQGKQQQPQQVPVLPRHQESVLDSIEPLTRISNERTSSTDSIDGVIYRREPVALFING